jgi:DNA-nicking Smr family endonuclease
VSGGRGRKEPGAGPDLSPEDRALWEAVTRSAVPLPAERRGLGLQVALPPAPPVPAVAEAPVPGTAEAPSGPRPAARRRAPAGGDLPPALTLDLAAPAVDPLGPAVPGLDRRTARQLLRGRREPEARIDLHGLSAERAHRALDRCIAAALARGQRLILVITGKGGRDGGGPDAPFMRLPAGLLRREVPRWLRAGRHAARIVGIYEAHPRHGGAGALYVYLKKRR